jgi:hypothetical protein
MELYAVTSGNISPDKLTIFRRMRDAVEAIKDPDPHRSGDTSCHHICVALSRVHPATTQHRIGHFGGTAEHSWLVLSEGDDGPIIADMYPVAGGSSFLVHAYFNSPWYKLYVPYSPLLSGLESRIPNFYSTVDLIAQSIRDYNDYSTSNLNLKPKRKVIRK